MTTIKEYWMHREENKTKAMEHYQKCANDPAIMEDVKWSVLHASIYPDKEKDLFQKIHAIKPKYEDTEYLILDQDAVTDLYEERCKENNTGKITLLNFASYKNPGGKFLEGSNAQEEALCHESNLYLILTNFMNDYYKPNLKTLNKALYTNNLIYIPNVLFLREQNEYADVITCAAPNTKAAKHYHNVSNEACFEALIWRILHVLYSAADNDCDTLILGAFGCGVFGNDPFLVAFTFLYFLKNYFHGVFKKVIFPVPKSDKNKNFDTMVSVFGMMESCENPPEVLREKDQVFSLVLKRVLANDL